ncbi:MAG: flagellar hook-associated protein FlgK [Pseudomonadales bacterium]|nr:flagellar hook-associated protein FlgK [Pseudomonadales bacterium]
MAEVLNIGTSGLLALQRAISTTSNNIVNANTEGYTRQTVSFESLPGQRLGNYYLGNGVSTGDIQRVYDAHVVATSRDLTASLGSNQTMSDLLGRVENLLADSDTSVSQGIQKFFDSLNALSQNPTGSSEREVVLSEAKSLVSQVHYLDNNFSQLGDEVGSRLGSAVSEINELAGSIAKVNERLLAQRDVTNAPGDLLDQRDLLLSKLAEKVKIQVNESPDGGVDVFIGNGQALVVGTRASSLATTLNEYDPSRVEVTYNPDSGIFTPITSQLSGGEIGGLLNFRNQVLDPARDQLGIVVAGMTETLNAQHHLGVDLAGNAGGDFFSASTAGIATSTKNQGTAALSVSLDDVGAVQATDYLVRYDGTNWSVIRRNDGSVTTGGMPVTIDGMTIAVSGAAQSGDSFLVTPTRGAASGFALAINRGQDIAAASPVRETVSATNLGDADISDMTVSSGTGLPLASDITLTFDPNALGPGFPGFVVAGAPSFPIAFDPATDAGGKSVTLSGPGGLTFTLSGTPTAGDSIVISNNTSGGGDNRNALALADLGGSKLVEGGNSTYQDAYGNLVARVGGQSRYSQLNVSTDSKLLDQANAQRESISGVNLDEEASNLLKYQQAYQAAARLVSAAESMFQVLINATGGR